MKITKAIAVASLAATLVAGPGLAIAQPTEHGNSATAHQNNDPRATARDAAKAQRQADRAARKASEDGTSGKAAGQPNFGTVVSGLHHNSGSLTDADLSTLSDGFTVSQVDLTSYDKGNRMRAIDNALRNVDATEVQTTLSANADVAAALQAQNIDVSTVAYAYVDASGNLVVYTR